MQAAVHAVNPHGWCDIPDRPGYADDLAFLRALLDADASLVRATCPPRDYTLLHYAAWGDGDEIGEVLIDAGAAPDARAAGGATPLAVACTYAGGDGALAARLARISLTPRNLRVAASLGRMDLVHEFVGRDGSVVPEAAADREAWDLSYEFPARPHSDDPLDILGDALAYAARNGQIAVAEHLLHFVGVNHVAYVAPAVSWAALYGREAMVDFLVSRGADVGLRDDEYESTAWEWARYFNHDALAARMEREYGT